MIVYDIALSFAGEDRDIAVRIAEALHKNYGISVFYDTNEQANLLGENLTEYLIDIYKNQASYCLILVSASYKKKRWTNHEFRAAQARAFEEFDKAYILPVRLDHTELAGLLETTGFLDLHKIGIEETIRIISEKVRGKSEYNKRFRRAFDLYSCGEYAKAASIIHDHFFDADYEALMLRAGINSKLQKYEEAIKYYIKAYSMRPTEFLPPFLLGISCFRIMKFEDAVRYYEIAARILPTHITALSDLYAARQWKKRMSRPLLGWYYRRWARKQISEWHDL